MCAAHVNNFSSNLVERVDFSDSRVVYKFFLINNNLGRFTLWHYYRRATQLGKFALWHNGRRTKPGLMHAPGGPFLESPGNFSGPKSNIQIEI